MSRTCAMVMLVAGAGCAEGDAAAPVGPNPVYDPSSPGFFDAPWPDDTRRDKEDGTISLAGFPNPLAIGLVDSYLARAEALDGFGTSSPVYLGFDGPFDPATLPTPRGSRDPESALVLFDVDPHSPYVGERFPVQWEQFAYADSAYAPEHLLAVAPVFGWPLRPATRYALVVTTAAARRSEAWAQPPLDRDLEAALPLVGLEPQDIAVAAVFTTQDPVGELARIAWSVQNELGPPDLDQVLEHLEDRSSYTAWRTHYRSPVYTHGEPPYQTEGGQFEYDSDGRAKIARWDDLRLAVCTPVGVEAPPEGWPVVIHQHGTGGDYRGFCDSDGAYEIARRLGVAGIVGLGIDQPLHGTRPGAESASDLAHFNIVNADSARTNFRQGAIDAIYLARALARRPATFRTPDGRSYVTDPERVMFLGHSQGGLTGALAAPFFAGDVKATMLSGAGGVLAITVVERKDIIDFEQLVRQLLGISEEEPLSPLHPTLGLVQTLVEITDPVNYAPYWFSQPGTWVNHNPSPVLLTSGTLDAATPYETAVALASAGRLPLVGEPASRADAVLMRSGAPRALPTFDTVRTFAGTQETSGFAQFLGGTHFVIFEEQAAADLTYHWLESTAAGTPALWIEDP